MQWTCCKRWSLRRAALTGARPFHRLVWIFCPGHAWIRGKEWTDHYILALRQWQTSHLVCRQGRGARGLRNFLNIDRPEHHRSPKWRKEERRREVADIAPLPSPPPPPPPPRGEGRSVFNQTSVGTVSRTTLGVCRETERGAYGPSRAQKCRLEQKLENRWRPCTSACTSSYRPGV